MRLLVVDDDHSVLQSIRQVLEDEGYDVSVAANGQEALARLHEVNPCLVLLDLMMPVMNGWEFRRAQLQDDRLASIPTVIMTADARADHRSEDLQASGLLRKPIRPDSLLAEIEKYCAKN